MLMSPDVFSAKDETEKVTQVLTKYEHNWSAGHFGDT